MFTFIILINKIKIAIIIIIVIINYNIRRKARKHYHKELEGETPRKAFDIKRFAMHFQFSGAYELGELYRESAKLKRYNYDSDSDDYDGFSCMF